MTLEAIGLGADKSPRDRQSIFDGATMILEEGRRPNDRFLRSDALLCHAPCWVLWVLRSKCKDIEEASSKKEIGQHPR